LRFLKRLEEDRSQIIWNERHKATYDRVDQDNEVAQQNWLGFYKNIKSDLGKYSKKNLRKPRPTELINE
jgi:hypothetical protein